MAFSSHLCCRNWYFFRRNGHKCCRNNGIKSKVEKNRFSYSLSWASSRSWSITDFCSSVLTLTFVVTAACLGMR